MNDNLHTDWRAMSDKALSKIIGEYIQHNRMQQNKTQNDTARDAGISRSTLSLLERGETVTIGTLLQVLRALDLLNVMDVFKIQKQISPIELAKLEKQKRQRVRNNKSTEQPGSDW